MNIAKNCKIERTASDNIDNKLVKEEPKQKEIQIESNIYKEGDKQVFNEDKNSFGRNDKMSLPTFMQITTEPA